MQILLVRPHIDVDNSPLPTFSGYSIGTITSTPVKLEGVSHQVPQITIDIEDEGIREATVGLAIRQGWVLKSHWRDGGLAGPKRVHPARVRAPVETGAAWQGEVDDEERAPNARRPLTLADA